MRLNKIMIPAFAGLFAVASLGSCKKDFLEKKPLDKLVPDNFFKTKEDLELYTTSFYQRMLPTGLAIVQDDEMGEYTSKNQSPTFIAGSYSPVNEGAWNWTNLRNINYFMEKFNNPAIPQEARDHYEGIARFFRAYFYFDKVQTYGDVPWYGKTLSTEDPDLY